MNMLILIPILFSFLVCVFLMPVWIKKCKKVGLLWEDMNKYSKPKNVASSGGIVVILAFVLGVLLYVAIITFLMKSEDGNKLQIFALLTSILFLAAVGIVDDLLGWRHGGLGIGIRIFLSFLAAIPLVVINVGDPTMDLPFFGIVNLGLLYPLVLIPLGIAGTTTTYNMLAGFNGLEAGQGIIIIGFLSFVAYLTGSPWLAIVGLCMVASLIAFYLFNKCPAKVFPGDIMTYGIGALIGGMTILGNFEKIGVFVFCLYIAETILKSRGKLKKHSFGIPEKDGSLKMPYDKIYGMTHLSLFILTKLKKKVYERDVVYFIFIIQIIICLLALVIFRGTLFR